MAIADDAAKVEHTNRRSTTPHVNKDDFDASAPPLAGDRGRASFVPQETATEKGRMMFVKVCGLRTSLDVAAAVESGADAVGFVLTSSPRQVDARLARSLAAEVPAHVLTVAVFARQPVRSAVDIALEAGVDAVQLHGDYGPRDYRWLAQGAVKVIRAASPDQGASLCCGAYGEDMLVVEAATPGAGRVWDWDGLSQRPTGRWMLAGGLGIGNVARAIASLSPWGVDVSSGVERRWGVKDPGLIRDFVVAAKDAPARWRGER